VVVENLALLLEKDKQRHRNWRFGARAANTAPAPANAPPDDRSGLPLLLDAVLRNAEVVIRTTSGKPLTLKLGELHWTTPAVDKKVALSGKGSWQGVPATLAGTLDPVAVLRQTAKPYPATIKLAAGRTTLEFTGTFTDPLNAEGAKGRLHLIAPGVEEILALAGASDAGLTAAIDLAGAFEHHGPVWRLTQAQGRLSGSPLKATQLAFIEGARIGEVRVRHHPRRHGKSNYGIDRTFRVLMDLLTVWFLAWMTARTTVYTLTNQRVVMRLGIVLTVTFNLPLSKIAAADLRTLSGGYGDITLALKGEDRIAWVHLWPSVRPWRITKPEPTLRAVANAERLASELSAAWSAVNGPSVAIAANARTRALSSTGRLQASAT
jgi:hypothetical protein